MTKELLDYFKGDDLAASVWLGKYALKNQQKQIVESTPTEMHRRLAKELARADAKFEFPADIKMCGDLSDYGRKLCRNLTEDEIFSYLDGFKQIVPQGSIMSQLGNPYSVGSISNCFVIPAPHDSYAGILHTDQELVQLMKRRGGVGTNLDNLRPDDSVVNNAAGSSTGAHSFMDRYSNTTREVAQNGRRGALMLLMSCNHPDIFKFVTKKKDRTKVTGANISVMLTDKFMKAAENNEDFICKFPIDIQDAILWAYPDMANLQYNVITTLDDNIQVMKIHARELFDLIVEMAWENAEPGLAFMDTVHNYSPEGVYLDLKAVASNPCGEQWMQAYDACRLLAINLFSVVDNAFLPNALINYDKLYEIAYIQQRLADNIVELEIEKVDQIIEKVKSDPEPNYIKATELQLWENIKRVATASRRTGCGFTALGDMLAALGFKYDSKEGIEIIERVMKTKMGAELDATIDMAITRGAFQGWNRAKEYRLGLGDLGKIGSYLYGNNLFFKTLKKEFPVQCEKMWNNGRRNVNWSTVAPTGTVSLMTQTSSGLEPVFSLWYMRRKKVNPSDPSARIDFTDQNGDCWTEYPIVHPKFKEWALTTGRTIEEELSALSQHEITELYKKSPWYGSTANDIDWIKRVEIQSIIQRYTTNAISSTINLPENVTKEKVAEIYMESWKKGLKGVTIYRDGSRSGVLVGTPTEKTEEFKYHDAPKRPKQLEAELNSVTVKGQKYGVVVGFLNQKPYEIFAFQVDKEWNDFASKSAGTLIKEKKGAYHYIAQGESRITIPDIGAIAVHADEQMLTRLVSGMMRHGVNPKFILEQIEKCPLEIVSFGKALGRIIKKFIPEKELLERFKCKECGSSNIVFEEGCQKCKDCGDSKCG